MIFHSPVLFLPGNFYPVVHFLPLPLHGHPYISNNKYFFQVKGILSKHWFEKDLHEPQSILI